jgi:hypothetical protein
MENCGYGRNIYGIEEHTANINVPEYLGNIGQNRRYGQPNDRVLPDIPPGFKNRGNHEQNRDSAQECPKTDKNKTYCFYNIYFP